MEISFYEKGGVIEHVTISDGLFLRLAKSEFSKVGKSKARTISLDGDMVKLPLVSVTKRIRTTLERFLVCFIAEEVERLIDRLGTRPTGRDIEPYLKDLQSLIQLSRAVANVKVSFLQRVP